MTISDENLRQVYNKIAKEFDHTRYHVWPSVKRFLDDLTPHTSLVEVGSGNCKNLLYRDDLKVEGIDLSEEMVRIGNEKGIKIVQGNILELPYSNKSFDTTLCIATLHHLDTRAKRVQALQELLRITKNEGKIMIQVWSMNQPDSSKRKFTSSDELVPWKSKNGKTYLRYYHIYQEGELEEEIKLASKGREIYYKITEEVGNYCAKIEVLN